jgi:hypothetical protein
MADRSTKSTEDVGALAETVICPTCGESVEVSLPRSAGDLLVVDTPDADAETAREADDRYRRLDQPCPAGHTLVLYFTW